MLAFNPFPPGAAAQLVYWTNLLWDIDMLGQGFVPFLPTLILLAAVGSGVVSHAFWYWALHSCVPLQHLIGIGSLLVTDVTLVVTKLKSIMKNEPPSPVCG